tara:strand:- start:733 stop:1059 length:327 start_codon:yes stop_codon:yes gene_type:complete
MIYTYWKGTIISKWEETHTETDLLKIGSDLIMTGLKDGVSIQKQIEGYKRFMDGIKKRKDEKKPIRRTDHNMGLFALMALVKTKQIDFDDDNDGIFIQGPRRFHDCLT